MELAWFSHVGSKKPSSLWSMPKLAHENNIPVQYVVTGGGDDGAVFTRFGGVDVAMGWPLRYAHSPAEVIGTRDIDGLSRIVAVLPKNW